MFNPFAHKAKKKEALEETKSKKKSDDWPFEGNWLWIKGAVAEPWATAKELFEDKELQKKIEEVQSIVNNPKSSQNRIR